MSESDGVIHVALLPSIGMGHLTPFLRLATFLLQQTNSIKLTLIVPHPTYTIHESQLLARFHSCFPQVTLLHFDAPQPSVPSSPSTFPYFERIEVIRSFVPQALPPLLSSLSPPLSFLVSDFFMISSVFPVTQSLSIPNYVLFTSSTTFFTFFSHFSALSSSSLSSLEAIEIPGVPPLPISSINPNLLAPNSIFRKIFMEDSANVTEVDGFIINTFEALEHRQLEAIKCGKVLKDMPPVFALGPFLPCEFEKEGEQWKKPFKWLDDQPSGSVLFVNFGSSSVFGWEQIREIARGLVRSGCRFLLVAKDKKYYKEEDKKEDSSLEEVLGDELMDSVREKGLVMKEWVYQSGILSHEAVGGFFGHCGWNSVIEAAWNGVPIYGWPMGGDQRMNAEIVEKSGWGTWNKNWGWISERLVKGDEIGYALSVFMSDESFKIKAAQIKEEARKARSVGGDCQVALQKLLQKSKNI